MSFFASANLFCKGTRYGRYYEEGRLCDVTLQAVARDGTSRDFNVHRIIMAGAGDVWEALLGGRGFLEEGQKVIQIHETDAETLGLIVRSVYGLEGPVSAEDCVHMINAADKFGMENLRTALSARFIKLKPIFADNRDLFLRILLGTAAQTEDSSSDGESDSDSNSHETAAKRGKFDHTEQPEQPGDDATLKPFYCVDEAVREYCEEQVVAEFGILVADEELLSQMTDTIMVRLLEANNLNMPEIEIFRAAMKWSELTDIPLCRPEAVEDCIRYPMMNGAEIAEVRKSELVCDSTVLLAYRARTEGHIDETDQEWPFKWLCPRFSQEKMVKLPRFSKDIVGMEYSSKKFIICGNFWRLILEYREAAGQATHAAQQADGQAAKSVGLWVFLCWDGASGDGEDDSAGLVVSYGVRCRSLPGTPQVWDHIHYKARFSWGQHLFMLDLDDLPPVLAAGGTLRFDLGLCVRSMRSPWGDN
eukprot:comp19789_c2_seq1/m.23743 comp19789_c2_seq1/g.23743  ORF comp19789_c2_seq1/g.23743 comp19789_c2_seq1/m.23743 type:complete len:475 (-) comp19789_c2_seq1:293-1717(-)